MKRMLFFLPLLITVAGHAAEPTSPTLTTRAPEPDLSVEIVLAELFGRESPASTDLADRAVEAFCHRLQNQLRANDPKATLPADRESRRRLWLNRLLGEIRGDIRETYGAAGLEEFNESK